MMAAVVAFDSAVLYEKLASSALVHPSRLKRWTMVVHVLSLPFQPWTNRIGGCAGGRGVRVSRARIVAQAGSMRDPRAASSERAAFVNGWRTMCIAPVSTRLAPRLCEAASLPPLVLGAVMISPTDVRSLGGGREPVAGDFSAQAASAVSAVSASAHRTA